MPDAGVSDFLIVGGGSAGCVLAARLSENPNLRVTLIEAGRDVSADMPPEIRSGYPGRPHMMAANLWPGLTANLPQRPDGEAPVYQRYEQPRILGGGSSINGLGANRGAHGDYDEWSALGITGWGFADLLPWFRKLERDVDHDGDPLHGNRGPIPVRRLGPRIWTPFVHAMLATSCGVASASCPTRTVPGRTASSKWLSRSAMTAIALRRPMPTCPRRFARGPISKF